MFERIKALCAEKGITVQTLEMMSGLSNGTITHWRNSNPRVSAVCAIANVLNSTVEYIYAGEGPAHPKEAEIETNEYLQKLRDDPNTRMLFDLAETAAPEEIKATVTFFKMLRNQGRDSE